MEFHSSSNKDKSGDSKLFAVICTILFFVLLIALIILKNPTIKLDPNYFNGYSGLIIQGYTTTIILTIVCSILSFIWGLILFLGKKNKNRTIRYITETWLQIIIGIPLYVQVILFYFLIILAIAIKDPIVAGSIILFNYMGTYIARTFEGSYLAISKQQLKIINQLNIRTKVALRKIIFPQILRISLPALTSHLNLLIKSTALLALISVQEYTNLIQTINSQTNSFVTGYVLLAVGYLIITLPLNQLANFFERKIKNENNY
jgi:polar amino acid transport system permease protein